MTVITGKFTDITSVNDAGIVEFFVDPVRSNYLGTKIITPKIARIPLVAGAFTSPDLEPGIAKIRITIGTWRQSYVINIPTTGPVQLDDLLDQYTVEEPAVVSKAWGAAIAASDARDQAVAAAAALVGVSAPTADNLSGATTVGRAVMKAADAAAARTATGAAATSHTHTTSDITNLPTALAAKADLVGGLIPTSQLPSVSIGETFPAATQAAMLALVAQPGDTAIRSDTSPTSVWMLRASPAATLGNWFNLSSAVTGAVTTVNGQTGAVVLGKTDIGLSNVDNVADVNKPVSTAQQSALDLKANKASPTFTGTLGADTVTVVGTVTSTALRVTGGTPAIGEVWTATDSLGNGSWQMPAASGGSGVATRKLGSTMKTNSWHTDAALGISSLTVNTTAPTWTSAKTPAVADLLKYAYADGGNLTFNTDFWVNAISGYGGGLGDSTPHDLVFNHDSTHVCVEVVALGNFDWKVYVDNRPYNGENYTVTTASYGSTYYINIVFTTALDREIRVALGHAAVPIRVNFEKTANVYPSGIPDFRVGYFADSWGTGQATTEGFVSGGAVPAMLRRATGWEVMRFCQGGTGYVSDPSGSTGNEPTPFGSTARLDAMSAVHAVKPLQAIFIMGSLNDKTVSATKAAVKSAAIAMYSALNSRCPGVPVIVAGVQPIDPTTAALSTDLNTGIYEACLGASNVVQFINWLTDPTPWISGTGKTGSLTGDGNRDFVIAADGLHLEQRGNRYIGRRIRETVRSTIVATV